MKGRTNKIILTIFICIILMPSLSRAEKIENAGDLIGRTYYNNMKALNQTSYDTDPNVSFYKVLEGKALGYNKLTKKRESIALNDILQDVKGKSKLPLDREFMVISSRFGFRQDPFKYPNKLEQGGEDINLEEVITQPFHAGLDFAAANINGSQVYNFIEGTVKSIVKSDSGYGNLVIVDNGKFETYYAHLQSIDEKLFEGGFIPAGSQIGKVGSTGRSTGPHLHLEIVADNVAINPQIILHEILEKDEHEEYMENFIFNIVAGD